ncbi:MAG TPA: YlxR family protein [Amycolatopsis sp.]|nr:YlxR family protein [Amycolatopsis sp.]
MVQGPGDTADPQRHRHLPVRTCVGCRQRALIGELLRVVVVDGRLVVDKRRRLPGRGAWLHPVPGCLAKAERKRAFPRALRVQGALDTAGLREHPAFAASEVLAAFAVFATENGSGTHPEPK